MRKSISMDKLILYIGQYHNYSQVLVHTCMHTNRQTYVYNVACIGLHVYKRIGYISSSKLDVFRTRLTLAFSFRNWKRQNLMNSSCTCFIIFYHHNMWCYLTLWKYTKIVQVAPSSDVRTNWCKEATANLCSTSTCEMTMGKYLHISY